MNLFEGRLMNNFYGVKLVDPMSVTTMDTTMTNAIKNPLVVYHDNCLDGFGAAWCFHYHQLDIGGEFDFHPGVYQEKLPDDLLKGRDMIYLVDFSYPLEEIIRFLKMGIIVVFLDHHKSAIENLAGLENDWAGLFYNYSDLNYSGAMLAWRYWRGTQPAPDLLHAIQDRDLWKFEILGSKAVCTALFEASRDFATWDHFMGIRGPEEAREAWNYLLNKGEILLESQIADIKNAIRAASYEHFIFLQWMPTLNCPPKWSSDAGNLMASVAPNGVALTWCQDGSVIQCSLRASAKSEVDVSALAKVFGGGGHKKAAGFKIPIHSLEAKTFHNSIYIRKYPDERV